MKKSIDRYFLEETCPFTKRRKVKIKNVRNAFIAVSILFLAFLLVFDPEEERRTSLPSVAPKVTETLPSSREVAPDDNVFLEQRKPSAVSETKRAFLASQIVKRSEAGNNGDKLPMGTTFRARLVNTVLSNDANSPVIAEIPDTIDWKGGTVIPSGTRAIGNGILDESSERLQVRFHTLVFPEGDQHSVSGTALRSDGSSGIEGNFHSRMIKKQGGRVLGNFLGGLAQGMKERSARSPYGETIELGSLKNGLLNGVSTSSLEEARSFAGDTEKLKAYVEVPQGTKFIFYLEKEFSP